MPTDKSKWEYKRLKISQLRPFPAQQTLYNGTTSQAEDEAFARDVAERGQLDVAHVMPYPNAAGLDKDTVLDGWRRANTMKTNGMKSIECYIRHDLAEATAAEVAAEFAKFNFQRRQLSGLARARCIQYLMETRGTLGWKAKEQLKTQIGAQLRVGLRTVNRYLAILDSPQEVQHAYDRGEISQVNAAKIGTLFSPINAAYKGNKQREFLNRIAEGESVAKVVREYIEADAAPAKKGEKNENQVKARNDVLSRFSQVIDDLDLNGGAIDTANLATHSLDLKKGKQVIERMLARIQG